MFADRQYRRGRAVCAKLCEVVRVLLGFWKSFSFRLTPAAVLGTIHAMALGSTINRPHRETQTLTNSLPRSWSKCQLPLGAGGVFQRPDFSRASRYRSMYRNVQRCNEFDRIILSDFSIAGSEETSRGEKAKSLVDESIRLSVAVDRWLDFYSGRWCAMSARNARSIMRRLVQSTGSRLLAANLEDGHIQDFWLSMKPNPGWAQYVGSYLASLCRWLQRRDVISRDLSTCWPVVPEHAQRVKVALTEADYLSLRAAAKRWQKTAIDILWWTGLRRANVLGLQWAWASPGLKTFEIPANEFKQGAAHIQVMPEALRRILLGIPQRGEYVLGIRRDPSALNDALKIAARRCGINPRIVYPHNWRASCCMRMREAGIPDVVVAQFMGWANTRTMQRYYVRPIPPDKLAEMVNAKL